MWNSSSLYSFLRVCVCVCVCVCVSPCVYVCVCHRVCLLVSVAKVFAAFSFASVYICGKLFAALMFACALQRFAAVRFACECMC